MNFAFWRSSMSPRLERSQRFSHRVFWRILDPGANSIHRPSVAAAHTAIHQCPVAAAAVPAPTSSDRLYGFRNAYRP